jgi:predicted transcriptional regulator
MDDLTSRFLDAFVAVERHLRTMLSADKHMTFNEMVQRAARKDKTVRRLQSRLKDLGELRNFLVHEYRSDQPVAVPSDFSVTLIEGIRDELTKPARLIDLFRRPVVTCAPSDPIGVAARKMHDGAFSQLPVYAGDELVGLLTSETVAHWLADRFADGHGILEEETVEEVLRHGDGSHSFSMMNSHATVDDALTEFDDSLHRGEILDAILLTNNGSRNERPLGIVTAADQPRLRSMTRA